MHAVVARSTCRSQNTQNTILGALLEVEMFKKCTPLWREAHLKSKALKTDGLGALFEDVGCGFAWQAQGIQHLAKSEQNVRVLWQFQKRWQAWGV